MYTAKHPYLWNSSIIKTVQHSGRIPFPWLFSSLLPSVSGPACPGWVHRTVCGHQRHCRKGWVTQASCPAASYLHSSKTNCRGGYIVLKLEERADSHAAAQPPPSSNWNFMSLLLWTWTVLHSHTPPTTMTSGCHGWESTCGWPYRPQSCNFWSVGLNALDRVSWYLKCALLTAVFLMGGSDNLSACSSLWSLWFSGGLTKGKGDFLPYQCTSCFPVLRTQRNITSEPY